MSASLHLARPEDLEKLLTLVQGFHAEEGIDSTDEQRRGALLPLLEGIPYGAIYLIGPVRAPIGYIIVTFTWSVEFGGLDGMIDEFFIRPAVRGRGIATEVLHALPRTLAEAGVRALHLEVDRDNEPAIKLYTRARFSARERYILMSRAL
ncbi:MULTISPECIES: GNAT family N-acetyltransferase [Tritonibacter]|uniref:Acetyltransferase n=1 Tax=Tritonibacter mobilis F1926 TaxID=1265309 RepID=A0A1B1A2U9_9RHOB|nr:MULTISPECIES: GNAT family N-acetyltransferase [Tritonibacter]EEW56932.1 acetyltransferase, gnat family [Ruegeria sp. TrichCH4B]MCZ4268246.1 GNAT family N-acetyltransferase [Rhodobacteraceae bacterium G21628-S1]MEE2809647.1 GNAT family N-acetyltransferase [Pseudomonadota bacterium]NKX75834.1 GNAT family N-acetyltransferase [Rhodobacteraceae bacterium R_SAG3]ANP40846.1 acetyltransferase [Tritonibacter mobilis F1926]